MNSIPQVEGNADIVAQLEGFPTRVIIADDFVFLIDSTAESNEPVVKVSGVTVIARALIGGSLEEWLELNRYAIAARMQNGGGIYVSRKFTREEPR